MTKKAATGRPHNTKTKTMTTILYHVYKRGREVVATGATKMGLGLAAGSNIIINMHTYKKRNEKSI